MATAELVASLEALDANTLRSAIRRGDISAPSPTFDWAVARVYTLERENERRSLLAPK